MDHAEELASLKAQVAGLWARYRQGSGPTPSPDSRLAERLRSLSQAQRQLAARRAVLRDQRDRQRRTVGQGARVFHGLGVVLGVLAGMGVALRLLGASGFVDTTTKQVVLFSAGLGAVLLGAWRRRAAFRAA